MRGPWNDDILYSSTEETTGGTKSLLYNHFVTTLHNSYQFANNILKYQNDAYCTYSAFKISIYWIPNTLVYVLWPQIVSYEIAAKAMQVWASETAYWSNPVNSVRVLSDPGLSHASVSSLFLCREKERDVWASCLLLGVSSDGFNHPWVPSSSSPYPPTHSLLLFRLLFKRSLTSISPLPLLSPQRCCCCHACFLSVPFVCESEWGVRQLRDLSTATLNQSGVLLLSFFFFLEPSVCDGHEWAVWSVSFFLLVGCPFLWLECIFTLLTLLSPPVIWSDHVSVVCCAEQVGFFFPPWHQR